MYCKEIKGALECDVLLHLSWAIYPITWYVRVWVSFFLFLLLANMATED